MNVQLVIYSQIKKIKIILIILVTCTIWKQVMTLSLPISVEGVACMDQGGCAIKLLVEHDPSPIEMKPAYIT